jgi:hypothetical protein
MRTATITLRGADFARKMSEMRVWLDRQSFDPIRFTYKQDREIIVISVDFKQNHQAEAFQSRFDGQQREMASSHRNVQKQLSRAGAIASWGESETRGTMAQACWWRLVAEEIRTEADNFGSEAARETMEMAARSWEQMAEELEDRLARNGDQRQGLFFR